MAIRGKNEGSIFRKPNGTWVAQVSVLSKRISHSARSRAECQAWIRQTLDQIDQGMTFEARNLRLSDYLREWIGVKKASVRQRTAFQYERLISLYVAPMLGRVRLKDLSLRLVNRFYERLAAQGVGVSHIRYAHRVLHAALEHAARTGLLGRNPAHGATLPKRPYREMAILNEQQVTSFLVAASSSKFRTLFHLAVTTGMRFSELRGLSWSDVDWIKGTISVKRQIQQMPRLGPTIGEPKTHSAIRTIRLGETSLDMLREHQQRVERLQVEAGNGWQERGLIFPSKVGTPFIPCAVQDEFHRVLEAASLPRIRFHDLRHTAASLMLSHGVAALVVSKILGHSSPSITLGIYAHSTLDMQDHAAGVIEEIVAPVAVNLAQLQPTATATDFRPFWHPHI
jgi:integrase